MAITMIGGGSRSGKSSFGLSYARRYGTRRAFVATAEALDEEMRDRIARHKADRGADFITYEEPLEVPALITHLDGCFDVIIVDCLTLWVSNLLLAVNRKIESDYEELIHAATALRSSTVFVTNEVGCGIVPENELARRFRDQAGRLNQIVAAAASEVYWMAFGIPMQLKVSEHK